LADEDLDIEEPGEQQEPSFGEDVREHFREQAKKSAKKEIVQPAAEAVKTGAKKGAQAAGQAAKKAAQAAAKLAAQAAARIGAALAAGGPAVWIAVGVIVLCFLVLGVTFVFAAGYKGGGSAVQAATLAQKSDVQELRQLLANTSLDLNIKEEDYQARVKEIQEKIQTIETQFANQPQEQKDQVAQLKKLAESLAGYTIANNQPQIKTTFNNMIAIAGKLHTSLATGKIIDFNGSGVVAGAIGPGTRHPIEGRNYDVYRAKDGEIRELIAQKAESLVGGLIDGKTNGRNNRHRDQCAALPNKVGELISGQYTSTWKTNSETFDRITGSPALQRGDIIHFLLGNSPYNTGNPHWAIQD